MPCHHPQQRGYITDQASESLHSVRSKRAENKGRLRTLMDEQVGRGFAFPLKGGRDPWETLREDLLNLKEQPLAPSP